MYPYQNTPKENAYAQYLLDLDARFIEGKVPFEELADAWDVFGDLLESSHGSESWRVKAIREFVPIRGSTWPVLRICFGEENVSDRGGYPLETDLVSSIYCSYSQLFGKYWLDAVSYAFGR